MPFWTIAQQRQIPPTAANNLDYDNLATLLPNLAKALLFWFASSICTNSSSVTSASLKATTSCSFSSFSPSSVVSNAFPFFNASALSISYACKHSGHIFTSFLQMDMFELPICMLIFASNSSCFLSMHFLSSEVLAAMLIWKSTS